MVIFKRLNVDQKILYALTFSLFAVLLVALVLPGEYTGRIAATVILVPITVITAFFVKKRSILSMNTNQVLMIMTVAALVYVTLYYLSGIYFGFYANPYVLSLDNIFKFILPTAAVVILSEIFRSIIRAQGDKIADILCYLSCVLSDALLCSTLYSAILSYSRFLDLVAETIFPALIFNLLYHYVSKRYGMTPNIVYRLVFTLHSYIIPVKSAISESLITFINILLPICIFLFIDGLYEKKRYYALGKKSKFEVPITVLAVAIMLSVIMLISNQFRFGTLVIATESMTGELNKGDAALFERYEDQTIIEGQVIVFEKDNSMIVHRVADIQIINGQTRYFTKGDANEELDAGYIYDSNIVGLVNFKIPYIGYPTLWLRSLFSR